MTTLEQWKVITSRLGLPATKEVAEAVMVLYKQYLEDFNRVYLGAMVP